MFMSNGCRVRLAVAIGRRTCLSVGKALQRQLLAVPKAHSSGTVLAKIVQHRHQYVVHQQHGLLLPGVRVYNERSPWSGGPLETESSTEVLANGLHPCRCQADNLIGGRIASRPGCTAAPAFTLPALGRSDRAE